MTIIMYHSKQKCFKHDDSSKKLYTVFANIMSNMQVCLICRQYFPKTFRTNGENYLKVCLLFNYMLHVLHKLPYDRRRKAHRLSQMIYKAFISTYNVLLSS